MTESYLRFFQLTEPGFSKETHDKDLWLPPSKQEVVDEICEAVQERSQVLLCGEPGVGKTCVLRAVRHGLPQAPLVRCVEHQEPAAARADQFAADCTVVHRQ